jgi:hypothetical protein
MRKKRAIEINDSIYIYKALKYCTSRPFFYRSIYKIYKIYKTLLAAITDSFYLRRISALGSLSKKKTEFFIFKLFIKLYNFFF